MLVNTSGHKVVDSTIAFDTGYSGYRKLLFHKYMNNSILNHQRNSINSLWAIMDPETGQSNKVYIPTYPDTKPEVSGHFVGNLILF